MATLFITFTDKRTASIECTREKNNVVIDIEKLHFFLSEIVQNFGYSVLKNLEVEKFNKIGFNCQNNYRNYEKDIKYLIDELSKKLLDDESYGYSWVANIAMAFQDMHSRYINQQRLPFITKEYFTKGLSNEALHFISNEAARLFLKNLTGTNK
jgi:hypothetical protein